MSAWFAHAQRYGYSSGALFSGQRVGGGDRFRVQHRHVATAAGGNKPRGVVRPQLRPATTHRTAAAREAERQTREAIATGFEKPVASRQLRVRGQVGAVHDDGGGNARALQFTFHDKGVTRAQPVTDARIEVVMRGATLDIA